MKFKWPTLAAILLLFTCTNVYLYDERRESQLPADRTVTIQGSFCTPSANEVVRPIKILLAMDASLSMQVTDPDGTRATALLQLLDNLPNEPEIYVAVMLFAGNTTAFLTKSNQSQFDQLISLTPADRQILADKLLNFVNPAPASDPNRDSTDFVKPLSDMYAMISRDIAETRSGFSDGGSNGQTRAKYSVIFLSDGHPTNNQDDELLCGDAVRRVRQLKDLTDDVRVNTVHVFLPAQPLSSVCDVTAIPPVGGSSCRIDQVPPGPCPLLLINQDAQRLEKMAELGGGDFRDFRNNEPINFLNFRFGQVRRTFEFDKLIASNFSALPGSPADQADTDGDGLSDADELIAGTNPFEKDTDKDGFSDGVEVHFKKLGASFNPLNKGTPDGGGLDPGCPSALRGVDSDCDGLTDCDEQIIGTNSLKIDSDDDGVPDSVEWQMQTQASSRDLAEDPDTDGLSNGDELAMHTNPLVADSNRLSTTAYRYRIEKNGPVDNQGRQCYTFTIDNIALAPTEADTRDGGVVDGGIPIIRRGAGYNDIFVSVSMGPGDDPTGHTLMKVFRNKTMRYPVGGIKSSVDGVIHVQETDLVPGCVPAFGVGP